MKTLLTLLVLTLSLSLSAQVFIDPSATKNGSGTQVSPYNTLPVLKANTTYLLKCGTTLTGNFSLSGSGITISSYGTGARPIIKYSDKTSRLLFFNGSNNTINGIDFIQGTDDDSNEALLLYGTNYTIKNCKVTGGAPGIEGYNGVKGNGGKITIYNVELVNSVSDALYINQLDYVSIKKVNVHDLAVTSQTSSSIDGVHIIYPLRVDIDSSYIDHSTAPGKYGLICTAQNIAGKSNGGMLVKNTTILSGSNQGCTFPALDTATFINCTFKGGMRFVQTPADILKMTNCTFTGTSQLIWGVESSENQSFTNCLFTSIPSGIKAILNPDATLKQVTINGVNYNGAYNGNVTPTPVTYTLVSSAGNGGTISPLGNLTVNSGVSQSYAITASSGYQTANVLVDGNSIGPVSNYTFGNITASHTISATFTPIVIIDPCKSARDSIINLSNQINLTSQQLKDVQTQLQVKTQQLQVKADSCLFYTRKINNALNVLK